MEDNLVEFKRGGVILMLPEKATPEELDAEFQSYQDQVAGSTTPDVQTDVVPEPTYTTQWSGQDAPVKYKPYAIVPKEIEAADLINNKDWMTASASMYQARHNEPFDGTPEELADWSRSLMAYFNYNIGGTGWIANTVVNSDQDTKEAFLYMMDTFDNTNMSTEGAINAAQALATDPTTIAALASLGIGGLVKKGAQEVGKAALREELKRSLGRTGVVLGTESAAIAGYDDGIRQNVEIDAGRLPEYDTARGAKATAIGGVAGAFLGMGMDTIASNLGKFYSKAKRPATGGTDTPTASTTSRTGDIASDPSAFPPDRSPTSTDTAPVNNLGDAPSLKLVDPTPVVHEVDGVLHLGDVQLPINTNRFEKGTTSVEQQLSFSEGVTRQFENLSSDQLENIDSIIDASRLTGAEFSDLRVSLNVSRETVELELKKAIEIDSVNPSPETRVRVAELGKQVDILTTVAKSLGSRSGYDLYMQRMGNPKLRNLTFDNLRKLGVAEPELPRVYLEQRARMLETAEAKQIAESFDTRIEKALAANNMSDAISLTLEKNQKFHDLEGMGFESASLSQKAAEIAVANVFSITTLQINAAYSGVKAYALPLARAVMSNPLELATRKKTAATYTAMISATRGAVKAAKASYLYEQSLLTRDPSKFLEGVLGVEDVKGGVLRTFIRATTATDEYLSQVTYRGFVAGEAAHEATLSGVEKGLKGKALNEHIKKATEKAIVDAYRQTSIEEALLPIITKGKNLGKRGEELAVWVEKEAMKDPEALRIGNNEAALTYVRDTLFKREFSGEGASSSFMKTYEETMNKHPIVKLITGQLFIRAPIRVMEEAVRLTPTLQLLAPKFIDDLKGKNGMERQLKAKTEAMLSVAIMGKIMSLCSEGNITGGGDYDNWRQSALQRDEATQDPYTIKDSEGNTVSYRFFDPLSTPVKTMVTALERMDRLQIRKAQGEKVDQSEFRNAMDLVMIAVGSQVAAIQDANLLAGFGGSIEAFLDVIDDDDSTKGFVSYLGEKVKLLTPNTIRKLDKLNDPTMYDPANIAQMIQVQFLDPWQIDMVLTSKAYDHFGRVKTITDTGALHGILSFASIEEREKGRSADEIYVGNKMKELQDIVDFAPTPMISHPSTGKLDFRTIKTSKGDRTLYDRWNELYYQNLSNEDVIGFNKIRAVLDAPLPDGTMKHKGMRVQVVSELINNAREIAFEQLQLEEPVLIQQSVGDELFKLMSESGMYDANRITITPNIPLPWELPQ